MLYMMSLDWLSMLPKRSQRLKSELFQGEWSNNQIHLGDERNVNETSKKTLRRKACTMQFC